MVIDVKRDSVDHLLHVIHLQGAHASRSAEGGHRRFHFLKTEQILYTFSSFWKIIFKWHIQKNMYVLCFPTFPLTFTLGYATIFFCLGIDESQARALSSILDPVVIL